MNLVVREAFWWCPQQDSNLRTCLRRAVLYPLSYGGSVGLAALGPLWRVQWAGLDQVLARRVDVPVDLADFHARGRVSA